MPSNTKREEEKESLFREVCELYLENWEHFGDFVQKIACDWKEAFP